MTKMLHLLYYDLDKSTLKYTKITFDEFIA